MASTRPRGADDFSEPMTPERLIRIEGRAKDHGTLAVCVALREAWAEIAHLEQTLEAMQRGEDR